MVFTFQELKQYPALRVEVGNAAIESLDRMKEQSKKATLQLVDMECCYLTVDFFRKLPQDVDKGGNPTQSIFDRYNDSYLRRIGKFIDQKKKSFLKDRSQLFEISIKDIKVQCILFLIMGSLTMNEQEQPYCLMLIWSAQLCATPFQSPSFIVKSVKLKEACSTSSTLNWVNWR